MVKKKPFEDKDIIGVSCIGGYYPINSYGKVLTEETKDILEGTYIDSNFKPVEFTDEEKRILFYAFTINIPLSKCWEIEDKMRERYVN